MVLRSDGEKYIVCLASYYLEIGMASYYLEIGNCYKLGFFKT